MAITVAIDPLEKGLAALEHGHTYLAMNCLEQAMASGKTPLLCSYLAYSLALNNKTPDKAVELAREALVSEPGNTQFILNLGRTLLLAGRKDEAIGVLRHGLSCGRDPRLSEQLERLGTRKPPVFPRLHRGHFVNKYCGIVLSRLGLR